MVIKRPRYAKDCSAKNKKRSSKSSDAESDVQEVEEPAVKSKTVAGKKNNTVNGKPQGNHNNATTNRTSKSRKDLNYEVWS